jgi:hypothetical protein
MRQAEPALGLPVPKGKLSGKGRRSGKLVNDLFRTLFSFESTVKFDIILLIKQ